MIDRRRRRGYVPAVNVEALIQSTPDLFQVRRGERTIFAGGRRMTVRTPAVRTLHLPDGSEVRVSVDDSGCATQIEEPDHLHAIARPRPIALKLTTLEDYHHDD